MRKIVRPFEAEKAYAVAVDAFVSMWEKVTGAVLPVIDTDDGESDLIVIGSDAVNDVTARAIDGIIEAYEHDTLPIYATQFHPERLTGILWDDRTPDYKPWFEHFVNLVKEHAEK